MGLPEIARVTLTGMLQWLFKIVDQFSSAIIGHQGGMSHYQNIITAIQYPILWNIFCTATYLLACVALQILCEDLLLLCAYSFCLLVPY